MNGAIYKSLDDLQHRGTTDMAKQFSPELPKVKLATHSDRLRKQIEENIATGVFPPGMRLDEAELSRQFEVSRTPVREALLQLSSIGITEIRPHRGVIVAEVTPLRLLEMFEVMAELEALCGRLAARRISNDEERELLAAHTLCEQACAAGDPDRYYAENETFHSVLYAASHSAFLAEQASALHRRLRPYRRLQLRIRNRMQTSLAEHARIIEALKAGDAETASDVLRRHVIVQGEGVTDFLAALPLSQR